MRNQVTTSRLSAWLFAPLLAVACGQEGAGGNGEFVTVPLCGGPDQVLSTNKAGQLICKELPAGAAALPDCKKYSESLTADGAKVFCTTRNNEDASIRTALENLEKSEILIKEYTNRVSKLGGGTGPAPRAVYCGQYVAPAGQQNPQGLITGDGVTGILGAALLCRKVATCSATTAKMCTVYDMYHSAATGVLDATKTVSQSWVWMTSWQHSSSTDAITPQNGLNDNCGGYTYASAHRQWYGTTVEWKDTIAPATLQRALHFASGPGMVACSTRFPIACCN